MVPIGHVLNLVSVQRLSIICFLAILTAALGLAADDANSACHVQIALVAGKRAPGTSLLRQLTMVRCAGRAKSGVPR